MRKYFKAKRSLAFLLVLAMFFCTIPVMETEGAGGRWKEKKSGKYYVKPNGKYATGSYKIDGKYYVFSAKGKLLGSKKRKFVNVGNKTYCVGAKGVAVTGWHIISGKLYSMDNTGAVRKNKKYHDIELKSTGAAKDSKETKMQRQIVKAVEAATNDTMTKSQKLRACWKYLISKKRFKYAVKYPDMDKKNWQRITAYDMLKTKKGNCFSFACAYAAMANALGYKSYVICGRIRGSRDKEDDGFTRHAWVKINDKFYDPEGEFAGWRIEIYGRKKYPVPQYQVQQKVLY